MSTNSDPAGLCRALNTISAWLALDDYSCATIPTDPAPVIVLFGNQVVATLTAACRLAQTLPQAVLLFSGGIGHATPFLYENLTASEFAGLTQDETLSLTMGEAELYAAVARHAFAIPQARIRVESQSTNGGENARYSLRLLNQEGLADAPVILLQDPLMQRRAVLTWAAESERAGLPSSVLSHATFQPRIEPGPNNLPQLIPPHNRGTWTFERYLGLLLGEIARLHDDENGYGPRGKNYLPHIDIPTEVWESHQRILASPLARIASR